MVPCVWWTFAVRRAEFGNFWWGTWGVAGWEKGGKSAPESAEISGVVGERMLERRGFF